MRKQLEREAFREVPKKPLTIQQNQRRVMLHRESEKSGLNQTDLALALDLGTPSTISNWLSGERPIPYNRVPQFCRIFNTASILWMPDSATPEHQLAIDDLYGRLSA